jgi:sporulation protein YlmC with PRC-barrel domain
MADAVTPASGPGLPAGTYDAVLHLLDRQIVDPDGRLVAKVDDLELVEREDGRFAVSALLIGPGALGPRLKHGLGDWMVAVWRRLRPDIDPEPGRIPMSEVVNIGSAVSIARRLGGTEAQGINGLEAWVREHVIDRLPGATDVQ